jgi:hypothetical protein
MAGLFRTVKGWLSGTKAAPPGERPASASMPAARAEVAEPLPGAAMIVPGALPSRLSEPMTPVEPAVPREPRLRYER